MDRCILLITSRELDTAPLLDSLAAKELGAFEALPTSSVEEAEPLFFEREIYLIIADAQVEGVEEILGELKQDEMFSHIPVLLILEERSGEGIKAALDAGFDAVLGRDEVKELLPHTALPLIRNHRYNGEMLEKISDLQEKAIRDFILLDLIKDYIPRTIWNIAKEYAHEQRIRIPEEETVLTIAFGDIKNFTPRTQHMEPKAVISYLNEAFDVVSRLVYDHQGDIDKYIGDAFLAVFRTPIRGVTSMLAIQGELERMNLERKEEDQILFRIGIHTGPIIRGNVGGNDRYDNTLIGDTVNTAARLEQIAPAGGILISEATRSQIGIELPEEYGRTESLKGREGEIRVWEIYDYLKGSAVAK